MFRTYPGVYPGMRVEGMYPPPERVCMMYALHTLGGPEGMGMVECTLICKTLKL